MNSELSELFTNMWNNDTNCCVPGRDYEINLQGFAKYSGKDNAEENLFTWVDEAKVFERPTFKVFRALLDNYETELGQEEVVTREEIDENWEFINSTMDTKVMQMAHDYLVSKGKAPKDVKEFKDKIYQLWFQNYRRTRGSKALDSSGFEHVFVGELKEEEVTGFHNWIQFYLQEKIGRINYKGFFDRGTPDEKEPAPHIMTVQFEWGDKRTKSKGTVFIGTSPEFELAVYTTAFLMDLGDVTVQIGDYKIQIICHKLAGRFIGTCFPKCLEE